MGHFIVASISSGIYLGWGSWLWREEQSRYQLWGALPFAIGYLQMQGLSDLWAAA